MSDSVTVLCARLSKVRVACTSDALAAMGLPDQAIAHRLRPIVTAEPYAGPVLCLQGKETSATPKLSRDSLVYEVDRRMTPGCVAVLAADGHAVGAVIGGNTIAGWRRNGCRAVVTDGGIRDVDEFEGLPTYASFVTTLNSKGRWQFSAIGEPIKLPGQTAASVTINPGDVLHCDRDGAIVVPGPHLAQLVCDVEVVSEIEARMMVEINAGRDRGDVYLCNDRFGHIKRVQS